MPSTASGSLRLQKMATGEKLNTWGDEINSSVIELIEDAIAGAVGITITGDVTLTSNNYVTDQARMAVLSLNGSPSAAFEVTIPAASKWYWIRNATSVNATITAGGTGAIAYPGETVAILCDGVDCLRQVYSRLGQALDAASFKVTNLATPTDAADAVTKAYADARETAAKAYADALSFAAVSGLYPTLTDPLDQLRINAAGTALEWFTPEDVNSPLNRWRRERV